MLYLFGYCAFKFNTNWWWWLRWNIRKVFLNGSNCRNCVPCTLHLIKNINLLNINSNNFTCVTICFLTYYKYLSVVYYGHFVLFVTLTTLESNSTCALYSNCALSDLSFKGYFFPWGLIFWCSFWKKKFFSCNNFNEHYFEHRIYMNYNEHWRGASWTEN